MKVGKSKCKRVHRSSRLAATDESVLKHFGKFQCIFLQKKTTFLNVVETQATVQKSLS